MSTRSAPRDFEPELLARLGLSGAAAPNDVERAHDDVVAFLEGAPRDLRAWAESQIAAADEAYALLSDPYARKADVAAMAATAAAPRAVRVARTANATPSPAAGRVKVGVLGRVVIGAAALVAAVTVGYIVYASDANAVPGVNGTPAPEQSQPALDTAAVAQLMAKIQADPNDLVSLQALGDLYFQAGQYDVASDWENKILAISPSDVTAHLALGAAAYNLGDSTTAEQQWRAALAVDPQNVEAHYDLGFMYFSQNPPNVDQTIVEWQKVIDIAPDSDIAQTVSAHLQTLRDWQSSASPSGAAPSAAPATAAPASTTPSAQPSAQPSAAPSVAP
jgi:tetratricopeptide (TPR) repeat protein